MCEVNRSVKYRFDPRPPRTACCWRRPRSPASSRWSWSLLRSPCEHRTSIRAAARISPGQARGVAKNTRRLRRRPRTGRRITGTPPPDDPPPSTPEVFEPSPEAEKHYELGNTAYDRNDLENAIDEYEQAIKLDGKYTDAYIELGAAYYDLSDIDSAIKTWQRALFLDKTVPELHNNLANASYVTGDYEKAVTEYREAISLRPGYYDALFGLGNALAALKRYSEAIPFFQEAIDARGTPFPDARSNMAWAMLRAGRLDDAEKAAHQAIDEIGADDPASVKSWYGLAAVLTEKGDLPAAAVALRKSIAVCAGCPPDRVSKIYYGLARVLEADDDRAGAADALERYLQLAPFVTNSDDIRRKIETLRGK